MVSTETLTLDSGLDAIRRVCARALRAPALHFLLIGAALFALDSIAARKEWFDKPQMTITAAEQAQRAQDWSMQSGRVPNDAERRMLIDQAIEDEVLYREALRRGLDQHNPTVRKRLVDVMKFIDGKAESDDVLYEKALSLKLDGTDFAVRRHLILQMRLLAGLPARPRPVTDADLEDVLRRHADQFTKPARLTLSHAFYSSASRGDRARADAERALRDLSRQDRDDTTGDPFPAGNHLIAASPQDLSSAFGERLAHQIATLSDQVWSEPMQSVYGWHLFCVHERVAPALATVNEARPRLVEILRSERAKARFAEYYPQLRARYEIHVENAKTIPVTKSLDSASPSPPETLD